MRRCPPTRASSSSSACEIGSRSGAISPLMSAETAAEVLPCMQVLTTAPVSPHRCCSKPPNPKAAGHVWYDFFWDVIPHASAHHSARLSPQVRLLLGRDPAYEPASEAGERPMGVELWAVSGTGRWLQGCMRPPPMAGPRRRPRGTTGPSPAPLRAPPIS